MQARGNSGTGCVGHIYVTLPPCSERVILRRPGEIHAQPELSTDVRLGCFNRDVRSLILLDLAFGMQEL